MKKIDITSTALEKGVDFAKDFLNKLIIPSVEETGLLLKDKIIFWRFKNQIKILNKTREYCIKNNINPKTISLKLLVPLLEHSSLEDNEILQEKWSILLGNMVDAEQNIENHVFPFLLGQISITEFLTLEVSYKSKNERVSNLQSKLSNIRTQLFEKGTILTDKITKLTIEINKQTEININYPRNYRDTWSIINTKNELQYELNKMEIEETTILQSIRKPETIHQDSLKDFEISNLVRLGLVKEIINSYAYTDRHQIKNNPESDYLTIEDLEITIEKDYEEYVVTELGHLFIKACSDK